MRGALRIMSHYDIAVDGPMTYEELNFFIRKRNRAGASISRQSTALTMSSMTFLASPKTIMVLSK